MRVVPDIHADKTFTHKRNGFKELHYELGVCEMDGVGGGWSSLIGMSLQNDCPEQTLRKKKSHLYKFWGAGKKFHIM